MLIIWKLLSKTMKQQFIMLFFLMASTALIDALIIASILPFLHSMRTEMIEQPNYAILSGFEFDAFIIGYTIVALIIIGTLLKIYQTKKLALFVFEAEAKLGGEILNHYIDKSYSWFLRKNLSDLAKDVLSEAGLIVTSGVQSVLVLASQFILLILVSSVLIFAAPYITLLCIVVISAYYVVLTGFTKRAMKRYGAERINHNTERFQKVNEILSAIKEFKIFGKSNILWNEYLVAAKQFAVYQAKAQFLSNFPRYVLECILMVTIVITVVLVHNTEAEANVLDTIILLTIAAYRLIPAAQQIFAANAQIGYIHRSLDKFENMNSSSTDNSKNDKKSNILGQISLQNLGFRYEKNSYFTLENVDVSLTSGKIYGVIGKTGSGKTTFIDILLGLLPATSGNILYTDKQNSNISGEKIRKSYVSQDFFMFDKSIYYNISLEKLQPDQKIVAVEASARVACVHDEICELQDKYDTRIGSTGNLLSGGQKQRVAIARAIYHQADLIVLDEATSAIDLTTEMSFLSNLLNLKKDKIIVFVTHRAEVLSICDEILHVSDKKILKQSTY